MYNFAIRQAARDLFYTNCNLAEQFNKIMYASNMRLIDLDMLDLVLLALHDQRIVLNRISSSTNYGYMHKLMIELYPTRHTIYLTPDEYTTFQAGQPVDIDQDRSLPLKGGTYARSIRKLNDSSVMLFNGRDVHILTCFYREHEFTSKDAIKLAKKDLDDAVLMFRAMPSLRTKELVDKAMDAYLATYLS